MATQKDSGRNPLEWKRALGRFPSGSVLALAVVLLVIGCRSVGTTANPQGDALSKEGVDAHVQHNFVIILYQGEGFQQGQEVSLSQLLSRGKPVVLNLWAGLCPPCRVEMPYFQRVYEQYGGRVMFVGVDVGPLTGLGSEEDGRALARDVGVTYPIGTTSDSGILRAYGAVGMPTTVFIAPDGQVVSKWTGYLSSNKLVELVEKLLQAS